jgi:hypothetical protein
VVSRAARASIRHITIKEETRERKGRNEDRKGKEGGIYSLGGSAHIHRMTLPTDKAVTYDLPAVGDSWKREIAPTY